MGLFSSKIKCPDKQVLWYDMLAIIVKWFERKRLLLVSPTNTPFSLENYNNAG